uniref:Uncharacterized protein n=1 Tax=Salmonella phage vB_SEnST11_KE23 TaxID=3161174 RepID=A0AAU8GG10_9CAUD
MEYLIKEENHKGRRLNSARYTISQRDDLKLFSIVFIDPDDNDFQSDYVEFWASDIETAYSELMENVTTFENYIDSRVLSECNRPLEHDQIRAWLMHYDALDNLVLVAGETKEEQIRKVLDFNDHCAYVFRKMCELVGSLRGAERFDGGSVYRESMHLSR